MYSSLSSSTLARFPQVVLTLALAFGGDTRGDTRLVRALHARGERCREPVGEILEDCVKLYKKHSVSHR